MVLIAISLFALVASTVVPQKPLADGVTFPRPPLAAGADTNSWLAYYNYGVANLRHDRDKAEAGFVWATRLDPSRGEPLFGRWVTWWRRNPGLWNDILKGKPAALESPIVAQVDSLRLRALQRNPFVPPVLAVVLYERLSGWNYSWDDFDSGLRHYSGGNYNEAVREFERFVLLDTANDWVREYIALAAIAAHRYDRAANEISVLLADAERAESRKVNRLYQSRELLYYGLGALRLLLADSAAARDDFGRALTENLAFYPAHAQLADMDLARGDTAQALTEYGQAMELGAEDGVLHYRYARLLGDAGRLAAAESELRRAIALEPYYAPPYLGLALVLETRGDSTAAIDQYRQYLSRTYRADPRIAMAQQRIRELAK